MINVELRDNGLDNTLKRIKLDLESVLGKNISKKKKDEMIYKTLGAVDALWDMLWIYETDSENESNT